MNKILTGKQIQLVDQFTIVHEPIDSINLMERAASRFYHSMKEELSSELEKFDTIYVVAGMGNNGGDGLALARLITQDSTVDVDLEVYVVKIAESGSPDFEINLCRLEDYGVKINFIGEASEVPTFTPNALLIDAIFGTGLNRPVEGVAVEVIRTINSSDLHVVSVDMPSGLFCEDNEENIAQHVIRAKLTLSFQVPKLIFFLPESEAFVGKWMVVDIGLHPIAIAHEKTDYYFTTTTWVKSMLRERRKFAHKGSFGHALLMAGSYGMGGAAVLSAMACSRSGCGLTTIYAPKDLYQILQVSVPEAMVITDEQNQIISGLPKKLDYSCVGVGPGIGQAKETASALKLLIQNASSPLVLDADVLNILAENKTWLAFLPKDTVLTPHPGEFSRLFGNEVLGYQRLQLQREMSIKHNVIIVLKGAYTSISSPNGSVVFNTTGNSGMASGGSGDVLTGLITGLIASGYTPFEGAVLGVYLHGLAGDLALENQSSESLKAGDLPQYFGKSFDFTKSLKN
jgi:ADP-dependent NAD(P)H-hydrate dehydratase / NAD(P)H-hydrate epimerase